MSNKSIKKTPSQVWRDGKITYAIDRHVSPGVMVVVVVVVFIEKGIVSKIDILCDLLDIDNEKTLPSRVYLEGN